MNSEESRTELGIVRIHKEVIASITAIAATEIEGVKRIGGSFKTGILEFIGKKFLYAIKVEIAKFGDVKIEVPLVIEYGCNIPQIAVKVQENIRSALEKMTNLSIKDININVQSIEKRENSR